MKKKIIISIAIILILVTTVPVLVYQYVSYHPDIRVGIGGGHGLEIISIAMTTSSFIPVAKEIEDNIIEVGDWNNEVTTFLFNNTVQPRDIKVSGEVVDGKTTLRYEGYYTTKDGQTEEYFEEKTFDFVLVPNDELLK